MGAAISNSINEKIVSAGELTELIRGNEQGLLLRFTPLVRRQSVTLDLGRVRRIDAAGITALLSLYASARQTGHRFAVANLEPRVAETLALVGLDQVLASRNAVIESHAGMTISRSSPRKYLSQLLIPA
jgi:anti-anti-sigma factor